MGVITTVEDIRAALVDLEVTGCTDIQVCRPAFGSQGKEEGKSQPNHMSAFLYLSCFFNKPFLLT